MLFVSLLNRIYFQIYKAINTFLLTGKYGKTKIPLYIYRSEVEDYPQEYYGGDAPAIAKIPISNIQHFRVEGSTYTESKISGGKITQDRYTGRIKQTAIKTKTVQHDNRIVRMSVLVNGLVKILDFEYSAFDVLCALLPDKEHK